MTATASRTEKRAASERMDAKMRPRLPRNYRNPSGSAAFRLAQVVGVKERSAEAMLGGERSVFKLAAIAARILRELGETERLAEKLVDLDLALAPEVDPSLTLPQALLDASHADAEEECPDQLFQYHLPRGTATAAMGRAFLRKSANQRLRHELAERLTVRWLEALEAQEVVK